MPVPINSRYRGLPIHQASDSRQQSHPTVPIRPSVVGDPQTPHVVRGVETLEYLAWKQFGTSEQWWRIADANPLFFPLDLSAGHTVNLPNPNVSPTPRSRSRTF